MARTPDDLAEAIIASLDQHYDLVYVDYRDQFTDDQVAAIVKGDSDTLWELTDEWESDSRWSAIEQIIADAATEVTDSWLMHGDGDDEADLDQLREGFRVHHAEQWETVREAVEERDRGRWPVELARATPSVLLRIGIDALDEDHSIFHEHVTAADVLTRLGIDADEHNVATVQYALDNADPQFSLLMGYWIVGADVETMYTLMGVPGDTPVEIDGPHLYLGNPFTGSGLITEEPLHATVTVKRGDLRTDKDAFGYPVDEVYGGLNPNNFEATLRCAPVAAGRE